MKWQSTLMVCNQCGREWAAVHPATCEYLECPSCSHMNPAPYIEESNSDPSSKCETCQNTATHLISILGMNFCDECLIGIDKRITMNTKNRTITDHKVNGLNEAINITVSDQPGPGGANHAYNVIGFGENIPNIGPRPFGVNLRFQNGPVSTPETMNGITNEALIAVVIDRLRGFQFQRKEDGTFDESKRGTYACKENACALTHLEESLMWLQKRTRDRMARGVEGTMKT